MSNCQSAVSRPVGVRAAAAAEPSASHLTAGVASREKVPLVLIILNVLLLMSQVRFTKSGLDTPSLARADDTEIRFID
eukprot:1173802-Prorocentrum_minimum.AAC.1